MYTLHLVDPRARRVRRYASSLAFFGSFAVDAGLRSSPGSCVRRSLVHFYPTSTVYWVAMSSTPGFDRATDILVPGVLGFHDGLYSGIRLSD